MIQLAIRSFFLSFQVLQTESAQFTCFLFIFSCTSLTQEFLRLVSPVVVERKKERKRKRIAWKKEEKEEGKNERLRTHGREYLVLGGECERQTVSVVSRQTHTHAKAVSLLR